MIDSIAAFILSLPVWVALLVVFLLPALESSAFVGFVVPGEIALILGGVIASAGHLPLAAVLAAGICGAVVGDSVGYLVGRRWGRGLLDGTLGRFVSHEHFDRAQGYLAERGGKAVFLGRFTAALRVMIPGLAGMSRMHYPRFVFFNVTGGALWATMSVLLGYIGGSSWQHVAQLASRIGLGALAILVVGFGLGLAVRHRRSEWVRLRAERLRSSRAVTSTRERFPRATRWVADRFDSSSPSGLALTGVSLAGAGATWLFLGITQDVVAHEELATYDAGIHTWVLDHRVAWLDRLMEAVTWLGSSVFLVPLLLVVGLVLRRRQGSWRPLVSLVVVYLTAELLHGLVGELVQRPRPPRADWLAHAFGWSYPSGHALQATVAYGMLFVLLAAGRSPRTRTILVTATGCLVVLLAATRVYLGMHWATDVYASMALGVAVLCLWGVVRLSHTARAPTPASSASAAAVNRH